MLFRPVCTSSGFWKQVLAPGCVGAPVHSLPEDSGLLRQIHPIPPQWPAWRWEMSRKAVPGFLLTHALSSSSASWPTHFIAKRGWGRDSSRDQKVPAAPSPGEDQLGSRSIFAQWATCCKSALVSSPLHRQTSAHMVGITIWGRCLGL